MSTKKLKFAAGRVPFEIDKSVAAADNFFTVPTPSLNENEKTTEINIEQNEQIEHNIQNEHNIITRRDLPIPKQKTAKPKTPKKHIHLILSYERNEQLEKMAGLQNLSVTKCLDRLIETSYNEKWAAISERLDEMKRKLEIPSPQNGSLNI